MGRVAGIPTIRAASWSRSARWQHGGTVGWAQRALQRDEPRTHLPPNALPTPVAGLPERKPSSFAKRVSQREGQACRATAELDMHAIAVEGPLSMAMHVPTRFETIWACCATLRQLSEILCAHPDTPRCAPAEGKLAQQRETRGNVVVQGVHWLKQGQPNNRTATATLPPHARWLTNVLVRVVQEPWVQLQSFKRGNAREQCEGAIRMPAVPLRDCP